MINSNPFINPMLQPSPWEANGLPDFSVMPGQQSAFSPIISGLGIPASITSAVTDYNTPGAWSTADQPRELGIWANVSASRAATTVYQNTSGRKMRLLIAARGANVLTMNIDLLIDSANPPGLLTAQYHIEVNATANQHRAALYGEVPPQWYYTLNITAGSIGAWYELNE